MENIDVGLPTDKIFNGTCPTIHTGIASVIEA